DPYLGEVAAVDSFLAPLLGPFLDGREKPALVVVTADHGEALGDHGEQTHGLFAYEATLKVPLVVWGPRVAPGRGAPAARRPPRSARARRPARPPGRRAPGAARAAAPPRSLAPRSAGRRGFLLRVALGHAQPRLGPPARPAARRHQVHRPAAPRGLRPAEGP